MKNHPTNPNFGNILPSDPQLDSAIEHLQAAAGQEPGFIADIARYAAEARQHQPLDPYANVVRISRAPGWYKRGLPPVPKPPTSPTAA